MMISMPHTGYLLLTEEDCMAEEKTFSAKQVAHRIGADPKQLRKFLRDPKSEYDAVGQGGRYDFPESELPRIREAFHSWSSGKSRRNRPTNAERELAKKAGILPKPRTQKEPSDAPRRRRNEAAPSPMDEDDLLTRCRSTIGERAKKHGLTTDRQGRWKSTPESKEVPQVTTEEAKALNDRLWTAAVESLTDSE
ncbi:hypothetical protein ACWIG4_30305 [Streptomyces sp. NPDC002248]